MSRFSIQDGVARFGLLISVLLCCRDEQAGPKPQRQSAQMRAVGVKTVEKLPPVTFSSGATWANQTVTYLGAQVEPTNARPGQEVTVRHFFQSTQAAPKGFRFFAHLVDADSLQQLANVDHEIQQGAAPLGTWPPGAIVEDVHRFVLPAGAHRLQVMIGFWNDTGRLPVDTQGLSDGAARVRGPSFTGSAQDDLKEYQAKRVAKAPKIDGVLDDAVWKDVPVEILVTSFDGQKTRAKTTFQIAYDDENLYVAFDCEDADVWGTFRKKDDPIYTEDAVEVFFDADGDGRTYNELQVSPHNVNFDASFVARRSDLDAAKRWESGMQSAVFIRGTLDDDKADEGWSAELRIPIKSLTAVPHVPPQPGDVWRFNAYRLEHFVRRENIEGQAFSPLFVGDFHALNRFARLRF